MSRSASRLADQTSGATTSQVRTTPLALGASVTLPDGDHAGQAVDVVRPHGPDRPSRRPDAHRRHRDPADVAGRRRHLSRGPRAPGAPRVSTAPIRGPRIVTHRNQELEGLHVAESITITDNRNGESIEIPLVNGGVAAAEWSKLLPGVWFYDPGFMSTAACESAITYLDGDAGILRYRGYPIEQLAENSTYLEVAYLLLEGRAAQRGAVRRVAPRRDVPHVHPRERTKAVPRGLPLRRPSDGDARLGRRRPLHLLPRRQGHLRSRVPQQADHPPHRQNADPGRGRPPLQRGHAVRLPGQLARLRSQLPLHALEGGRAPVRGRPRPGPRPRHPLHPPRRPRAELLDHGHARRRAPRTRIPTRPPPPPRPRSTGPGTAAPTRPSSACSPKSAASRTCRTSSPR